MSSLPRRTSVFNFAILLCIAALPLQNSITAAMSPTLSLPNNISLYLATWNVAGTNPEEPLYKMLGLQRIAGENPEYPDVYAVAFQEVTSGFVSVLKSNILFDNWTIKLSETLKDEGYARIHSQQLWGMVINVFALRKHIPYIRNFATQYQKTGLAGFTGNKGAVSMRMNIYGVNVCFVNSHLPPHDADIKSRISNYHTIIKNLLYPNMDTKNILDHDYAFWLGDLNFRIDGRLSGPEIANLIHNDSPTPRELLLEDQLNKVRNKKEAFAPFQEELITFPPTFKYSIGSNEFDFKRRPAWTDRILYKVNVDKDTRLAAIPSEYSSSSAYIQSDHKPVFMKFVITTRPESVREGVELTVSDWLSGRENTVRYRYLGGYKPSAVDYIALMREDFVSILQYETYEYIKVVPTHTDETNEHILHFGFSASKETGCFRLVYMSQRAGYSVLGMSNVFAIEENPSVQNCLEYE